MLNHREPDGAGRSQFAYCGHFAYCFYKKTKAKLHRLKRIKKTYILWTHARLSEIIWTEYFQNSVSVQSLEHPIIEIDLSMKILMKTLCPYRGISM